MTDRRTDTRTELL